MLVECGLVRATTSDGAEFTFRPSLGRIASLADPAGIVRLYGRLFGERATEAAAEVLIGLCDQDDLAPLIGEPDAAPDGVRWIGGAMPPAERVIVAQHLMRHGIVGKARPSAEGEGAYSDKFEAAQFIAAARVHLGLSSADAEALSMTELQTLLEMKFPESARGQHDTPTRERYEAAMKMMRERHGNG